MMQANDPQGMASPLGGTLVPRAVSDLAAAPVMIDDPAFGGPNESGGGTPFSMTTLIERKWTILCVAFLVAAVAIPLIWLLVVPQFRTTATVRIAPVIPRVIFKTEENGIVPMYTSFLNTQVSIIRSPKVLQRVLESQSVQNTSWYREPSGSWMSPPIPPLQRLRESLSVSPRKNTELIDVTMRTKSAMDAKVIVDTVVEEYVHLAEHEFKETDKVRFEGLEKSIRKLGNEIDLKTREKSGLSKILGTDEPEELRKHYAMQLNLRREELSAVTRDREINEWRLSQIKEGEDVFVEKPDDPNAKSDAEDTAATPVRYFDDVEWRRLHRSLAEAKNEMKLGRDQYGEQHPKMKALVARVDYFQSMLDRRQMELDDPRMVATAANAPTNEAGTVRYDRKWLERAVSEGQKREELLEADINEYERRVHEYGDSAVQLAVLNEEIAQKKTELNLFLERRDALETEGQAAEEIGRVRLASMAIEPTAPDRDRRILLTLMALAGAFMAGVGVAFLRSMLDPSVRGASDVTLSMQIPFLGQLPKISYEADLVDDSNELFQEHMRMVRTALLERLPTNGKGSSVLVTSPMEQAGKTSVAISLAKSLALLDKKVLLLDADLRRAGLSQRLGLAAKQGLTDLLAGKVDDGAAISPGPMEKIHVIPAGRPLSEHDAELMANGTFARCLRRWKEHYDYVVLDSPPVLPVADARILAGKVDGTILAVRASHSRRTDTADAVMQLSNCGGRTLGTVLVGYEPVGSYSGQREYYGSTRRALISAEESAT